jgi:hydrogenase maturation protease
MNTKKILVIGLGNPILGDDGVGWKVGEAVQDILKQPSLKPEPGDCAVEVECVAEGGLRLMEIMVGYDYSVVIDAVTIAGQPVGSVSIFPIEALPERLTGHFASPHNTTLQVALRLGREMGLHLPQEVTIVGIEAQKVYELSEELTAPVQEAVPQAVRETMRLLEKYGITK